MSLKSAQEFVEKMKQEKAFREKAGNISDKDAMYDFIIGNGFHFEENHLVASMAACMDEMEGLLMGREGDKIHTVDTSDSREDIL